MLTAMKWTLDEYHRLIETGFLADKPVELAYGNIIEMAPEGIPHGYYSSETQDYLATLLGHRAKLRQGKPITLPNQSEPQPDIAIIEPLGTVYLEHHPYPENIFWLIEYSNATLEKDTHFKRKLYAEAEIREYWVVNLRDKELIVYREAQGGDYRSKTIVTTGEISPISFPDVAVTVNRLF